MWQCGRQKCHGIERRKEAKIGGFMYGETMKFKHEMQGYISNN